MALIQFSLNNQRGYGLVVTFLGWSILFQFLPLFHATEVIGVGASFDDGMPFLAIIASVSVILMAVMATVFEKWFNAAEYSLLHVHSVVLVTFVLFNIGYFFGLPLFEAAEPFLGFEDPLDISGWVATGFSQISGLILVTAMWLLSERFPREGATA